MKHRWRDKALLIIVVLSVMATAEKPACDWSGSGLDSDQPGSGVRPVYLTCSKGSLEWLYPRGALRVLLRLPVLFAGLQDHGQEFRGCLKVVAGSGGARVFLEGHQHRLRLLWSSGSSGDRQDVVCFRSIQAQAALYVEAEPITNNLRRDVIRFTYDLEPMSESAVFDQQEDCRPCSDAEVLHLYCISDFVAIGTLTEVRNNEDLQRTEVVARASKVLRQNGEVFKKKRKSDPLEAILTLPLYCGARYGSGQFLFIGRKRLGEAMLRCAPRLEDWAQIRRKGTLEGKAECVLAS